MKESEYLRNIEESLERFAVHVRDTHFTLATVDMTKLFSEEVGDYCLTVRDKLREYSEWLRQEGR